MVNVKGSRGLPPLNKTKLSEKSQESHYEIQKYIYEANMWWNDWKLQLHCKNLDWVDPKYKPKIIKPFYVSSKNK